jgi:hypothetical protein
VTDWGTIASLATAGGSLVLGVATFSAVRSANRSNRVTERALMANIRPVIVSSRFEDPTEKVGFMDVHWLKVPGGRAVVDVADGVIYLAASIRNVGAGLAVLDRWDLQPRRILSGDAGGTAHRDLAGFRRLTRDLYIPAGDTGFWQGALRDPDEPAYQETLAAIGDGSGLTLDLLYGDHEGGQRTVTRFGLVPGADPSEPWVLAASRHWNLDRDDPR